ncbi:hypothetical protein CRYUN_Cryun28dG0059700 [Craigia yunnanensis]
MAKALAKSWTLDLMERTEKQRLPWHWNGIPLTMVHPGYYSPRKQKGMDKLGQLSTINPKFFLLTTCKSYLLYLVLLRGNARGEGDPKDRYEPLEREKGTHFPFGVEAVAKRKHLGFGPLANPTNG